MAYKLIDISAAAIPDGGLYHLEGREDGHTCVLEGDIEGQGRVVDCFNTVEDAESYLSTLVEEVIEYAAEEVVPEEEPMTVEQANDSTSPGNYTITVNPTTTNPTELATRVAEYLQSHAAPPAPPADFFTKPPLAKLERYVTVTDDGRIYGHYAGPEECHISYLDRCVPAPMTASSLDYWTIGQVKTAEGTLIPTGPLALRGGHSNETDPIRAARAHYDDIDSGIADIVVGLDEHGGWFSGALRPGVSPESVRKVLASGVSGDWRAIDGELRLIGICSVNRPGFPKVAVTASAEDGELIAVFAAGGPPLPNPDVCGCNDAAEIESLKRLVADAGITDIAIDKLSSRIPADEQELDELYERVTT